MLINITSLFCFCKETSDLDIKSPFIISLTEQLYSLSHIFSIILCNYYEANNMISLIKYTPK